MTSKKKNASPATLGARADKLAALVAAAQFTDAAGAAIGAEPALGGIMRRLRELRSAQGSLFLVGNGGSAAVASHALTDFINVAALRAFTVHEPSLLTCMANDYGYESAFARIVGTQARAKDLLVAISSSGKSVNIRNAALRMRELGGTVITLSGFGSDNPLRRLGEFNVWLDSADYGLVEIGHLFILHHLADRFRENR